jgi:hypothetical protein
MFRAFLISVALIAALSCGCSSFSGSPGTIAVVTTPPGAGIYLDNAYQGVSPMDITGVVSGMHTVELRFPDGYIWSTEILVSGGGISHIDVLAPVGLTTPEAVQTSFPPSTTAPGLLITNMKGYQGGGNYITRLTFDLALAPGEQPVDLSKATFELQTEKETINPYWQILDRRYVSTDSVLTAGDTFAMSLSTQRINAGETFTLVIAPENQEPTILTKQVPDPIGVVTSI